MAAITIPTLVSKYQEKVIVTEVVQSYSLLSEAFKRMITEEGTIDKYSNDEVERINKVAEYLPRYMKVERVCEKGYDCFKTPIIALDGASYNRFSTRKGLKLSNGINLVFMYNTGICTQNVQMSNSIQTGEGFFVNYGTYYMFCGSLFVDVNGDSPPNTFDKDIFQFQIVRDGILPAGSSKETVWTEKFENQCLQKRLSSVLEAKCTGWVIENRNLDYLHCPDELGWDKKRSCKE